MRNFEERMDEIRRRSNLILRKRKQRKKRLLTVIPMVVICLVPVVFLVSLLGNIRNTTPDPKFSAEASPKSEFELFSDAVKLYSYEETYKGLGVEQQAPDAAPNYGFTPDIDNSMIADMELKEEVSASRSEDCIAFQVLKEDGTTEHYTLQGNVLTNTETKETQTLTQEEAESLRQRIEERRLTP